MDTKAKRKQLLRNLESAPNLGSVGFSVVYLVEDPQTAKKHALKVTSLVDAIPKEIDYILNETKTLAQLSHDNIVQYFDSWEENKKIYLLMEYCHHQDLSKYLKTVTRASPSEADFVYWIAQISSALVYIHDRKILHRNVKTSNIMVSEAQEHLVLKLGDFGMSKVLDHPNALVKSRVGTPYYMSPEIMKGILYNSKTDIWSLGCTAYEVATFKQVFSANSFTVLMRKVLQQQTPDFSSDIKYSQPVQNLIQQMLSNNPDFRPSASQILQNLKQQQRNGGASVSSDQDTLTSMIIKTDIENIQWGDIDRRTEHAGAKQAWGTKSKTKRSMSQSSTSDVIEDSSFKSDLLRSLRAFSEDRRKEKQQEQKPKVTSNKSVRISLKSTMIPNPPSDFSSASTVSSSASGYQSDLSEDSKITDCSAQSMPFRVGNITSSQSGYESGTSTSDTKQKKSSQVKTLGSRADWPVYERQIWNLQCSLADELGQRVVQKVTEFLGHPDDVLVQSRLHHALGENFEEYATKFLLLKFFDESRENTKSSPEHHDKLNRTM